MSAPVSEGADAQRLVEIAGNVEVLADEVEEQRARGRSQVGVLQEAWSGPDLERFTQEWPHAEQSMENARRSLADMGQGLRREAPELVRASAGTGGITGPGTTFDGTTAARPTATRAPGARSATPRTTGRPTSTRSSRRRTRGMVWSEDSLWRSIGSGSPSPTDRATSHPRSSTATPMSTPATAKVPTAPSRKATVGCTRLHGRAAHPWGRAGPRSP